MPYIVRLTFYYTKYIHSEEWGTDMQVNTYTYFPLLLSILGWENRDFRKTMSFKRVMSVRGGSTTEQKVGMSFTKRK